MTDILDRDRALFEAGIKLGALYHQFVGTPVSAETAGSLEEAISKAIGLQPYVDEVHVTIDRSLVRERLTGFGYCELNGDMLHVRLTVKCGSAVVEAALEYDEDIEYPLMKILSVKADAD